MTYRELCRRLEAAGVDAPEWDAACLIAHACGLEPPTVRLAPERDYVSPLLDSLALRRAAREPLQYILGTWDFYRQSYLVSPHCLIPRADTECLVEQAIRLLPHGAHFADLCTGSGCIAVSTLAERPDTTAVAVEKFPLTLDIALQNAKRNGVGERFSPLCADVLLSPDFADGSFDAILSNPPYIARDVLDTLSPEVKQEPVAALDGGEDGLLFYRAILTHWTRTLKPHGILLLEIGYDQGDALLTLGREFGFDKVQILKDLGGNDRVALLGAHRTP